MKSRVRIGTRGSKLALIQAESVSELIKAADPEVETSLVKITTAGDRDRRSRLGQVTIGAFVRELEQALLDGRIDIAVHSLKDLPVDLPGGLVLQAVIARLDPRDVLVAREGLEKLPPGSRIGTGSLRRAVQLARLSPDIQVCNIRGNVPTRLQKVSAGQVEGVVVAAAAMLRLGYEDRITAYLPLESFLPAVGQGVLAVEARSDDRDVTDVISKINHLPTWQCVTAERAFLRALGGGCRAPIAALGTLNGDVLKLEGMIASSDGSQMIHLSQEGSVDSPEPLGEGLAHRMLDMGADKYIAEAGGL